MLMAIAPMAVGACLRYESDSRLAILDGRFDTQEDATNGNTATATTDADAAICPANTNMTMDANAPVKIERRKVSQADLRTSSSSTMFLAIQARVHGSDGGRRTGSMKPGTAGRRGRNE
ncbi:MAG: hypothetical protein LUQ16_02040 [Methanomassiliicoccales archaeon]|nr:hypothetical protein [Methanomassiliicoccales archaeon]